MTFQLFHISIDEGIQDVLKAAMRVIGIIASIKTR